MVSRGVKKILGGVLFLITLSFSSLVDKVVASVNYEPILESDLKMGMLYYGTKDKSLVISKLVEDWLLYQFLVSKGMQTPPELMDETLQNIARANKTTVEGIAKELEAEGLTLRDLRRFLEREILATEGLKAFLEREVKVSESELELEKLKKGEVKPVRLIELLVVDKKDAGRLKEVFKPDKSLEEVAKDLGSKVEKLRVSKGELVDVLDKEVWRASLGEVVFAEDKEHVYLARVVAQEELYEGKSPEELRRELLSKKLEERRRQLLEQLRKNSFIKIF